MTFKVNFRKGLFILKTFLALPIMQKLFSLFMTILCIEETFYAYMALPSLHGRKTSNILESYSFRTKDKYFKT